MKTMIASVKKSMKAARGPRVREGLSVVRRGLPAILVGIGLLLGGCASRGAGGDGLGYYWQSLRGQMHLLQASRPIDDWLQDESLAPALRERSEEHTSELQSPCNLVCRLLLEKKNKIN